MPRHRPAGPRLRGRPPGSPNRATRELKRFLQSVFAEAFATPKFRADLLRKLLAFKLDPRLLRVLLAYAYGAPARQVSLEHQGHVTLAQLVSGSALAAYVDEDDEDDETEPPLVS